MSASAFEIASPAAVGAVLFLYDVIVVCCARSSRGGGGSSLLSIVLGGGSRFITKHIERDDPQTSVLAVQALRNVLLVAIFVGGIAFQAFQASATALTAPTATPFDVARLLLLSTALLGSFLNFALVIRVTAHLGYLLGSAKGATGPVPAACYALIRSSMVHFSLGFRCVYASVPFAYGAAGPLALAIAGALMFLFQLYADYFLISTSAAEDGAAATPGTGTEQLGEAAGGLAAAAAAAATAKATPAALSVVVEMAPGQRQPLLALATPPGAAAPDTVFAADADKKK